MDGRGERREERERKKEGKGREGKRGKGRKKKGVWEVPCKPQHFQFQTINQHKEITPTVIIQSISVVYWQWGGKLGAVYLEVVVEVFEVSLVGRELITVCLLFLRLLCL